MHMYAYFNVCMYVYGWVGTLLGMLRDQMFGMFRRSRNIHNLSNYDQQFNIYIQLDNFK